MKKYYIQTEEGLEFGANTPWEAVKEYIENSDISDEDILAHDWSDLGIDDVVEEVE